MWFDCVNERCQFGKRLPCQCKALRRITGTEQLMQRRRLWNKRTQRPAAKQCNHVYFSPCGQE